MASCTSLPGPKPITRLDEQFLAHLAVEHSLSHDTISSYRRDLTKYFSCLRAREVVQTSDVRSEGVASFVKCLERMTRASVTGSMATVRSFRALAFKEGRTGTSPTIDVRPPKIPSRLPKAMDIDDVAALITTGGAGEGPTPLRDRVLLEVLYRTGAHISEAVRFSVGDADLVGTSTRLFDEGHKERVVPLGGYAVEAIDAYLVCVRPSLASSGSGTPSLLLSTRGRPSSRQSARTIAQNAVEHAKLSVHVSPHTLRRSLATHLLQGGADIRVVQELLGHPSLSTTQMYTMVSRDTVREVYALAHPRALS